MSRDDDRVFEWAALSEAELVVLASAGRGEAFNALMQRYDQRLYRVTRSVITDDIEAEDVLQESYLRAFAALDSFRGESTLLTWLTRITLNEARGRLRRRRRSVELDALEAPARERVRTEASDPAPGEPNPEAVAARAEIRRVIEAAVDALPEALRLVFVLRDIEDSSTEETAAQLGLRPETVKTRLHRARRLLRERLPSELHDNLGDTFPFCGARCRRLRDRVLGLYGRPRKSFEALPA